MVDVYGELFSGNSLTQPSSSVAHGVHVEFEGERHHVGFETVGHFQGLLAGTAVRLRDFHFATGLFFPVLLEDFVVVGVEFARRVIRHVGERLLFDLLGRSFALLLVRRRTCAKTDSSRNQETCRNGGLDKILIHSYTSLVYCFYLLFFCAAKYRTRFCHCPILNSYAVLSDFFISIAPQIVPHYH